MTKQLALTPDYRQQIATLSGTEELDSTTVAAANEEDNPRAFGDSED